MYIKFWTEISEMLSKVQILADQLVKLTDFGQPGPIVFSGLVKTTLILIRTLVISC